MIGLNEEINTKECIFSFGFCLRKFSKEEVSGVEEKGFPPLFSCLGDKS
jgi:hypothetical protein